MLEMFSLDDGTDPFALLATKWLNKPADQISRQDRDRAKQLAYAQLYGMVGCFV